VSGAVLLLVLTGCQKPTPGVTLVSGGATVHTESTTYCRAGQSVANNNCVQHTGRDRIGVLRVQQGAVLGIDVDKALAKNGWFLYDADAKARSEVQDTHYFSYTPDFSNRPTLGIINLEIRSTDRVADDAQVTGVWRFQLVQK
jgi:hypothetical protein